MFSTGKLAHSLAKSANAFSRKTVLANSTAKAAVASHLDYAWNTTTNVGSSTRGMATNYRPRHQRRGGYSKAMRARISNSWAKDQQPSLELATAMPMSVKEMGNESLVTIAATGSHLAREEVLKRHIMATDQISYDVACLKFEEIAHQNAKGMIFLSLPYQIGITMAVGTAFVSIPLVFDLSTAAWFNEAFVTTDVPEPRDLETALEVGSWTWNWMEPVLGQISFFLLCLQYSRAQLDNLGVKPYTGKLKQLRGERLARLFPTYDARLLIAYSQSAKVFIKQD